MTEPTDTIERLGLTLKSVFVPFSQSRNKGEKSPSLNWTVTLQRNGRDILTTDYSAGCAHCPAYKSKPPHGWGYSASVWQHDATAWECEHGRAATAYTWSDSRNQFSPKPKTEPLTPKLEDVIYSLQLDASAIDEGSFVDWAASLGYDPDSRKAEKIWAACIETGLKLRAAIGDSGLEALRVAFQDY